MKLYEFAPTRSIRVRWTLQELGVDFEAVTVDLLAGEHRSPAFLKINPAGKLPVLVDGDMVLTESVAIVLYWLRTPRQEPHAEKPHLVGPFPSLASLPKPWGSPGEADWG